MKASEDDPGKLSMDKLDWPGTAGARAPLGRADSERESETFDDMPFAGDADECDQSGEGSCEGEIPPKGVAIAYGWDGAVLGLDRFDGGAGDRLIPTLGREGNPYDLALSPDAALEGRVF